jgi:hypothetical protein
MSENKYHCVEIDANPELWDKYVPAGVSAKIDEAKVLYDRRGECNRCGSCCYYMGKDGKRHPCKYLSFDGDKAICTVHSTEDQPKICKDFPVKPDINNKHPDCGFYWVEKGTDIVAYGNSSR